MIQATYDYPDAETILNAALPLFGKTLRDFLSPQEQAELTENIRNKGDLGNLVEKYYFHINPGNASRPDFFEAGVELKTSAVLPRQKIKLDPTTLKPAQYYAKERLKLTVINYEKIIDEKWQDNSLFKKCETILLLLSLYESDKLMIDRKFVAEPLLWSLPAKDLAFIRNDWNTIVSKVKAGKAHELSGSDTLYLEACTSGTGKLKSQPNSTINAKERSFAFKASYVNAAFLSGAKFVEKDEQIIHAGDSVDDFETIVLGRANKYAGVPIEEISRTTGKVLSKAKQRLALLSYAMLSIRSKNAEEFVKAGIEIKTINLQPNGTPAEDISFPAYSYMDIVNEDWEDSFFKQKLDTKMLLMIFQTDTSGQVSFKKAQLWSMPAKDVDEAQRVWQETKRRVASGDADNPPLKGFSTVAHARNHGRDSKPEHYVPSPKNGRLRERGFWLNALYMKTQL